MHIDWWTLGLQAINVLILIWILSRFLFKPVAAIVEARRASIARLLDEAHATRVAAEAEREKARQEVTSLATARAAALQKAEDEAKAETETILANARSEAGKLREAAKADIARARQDEAAAMADHASQLAVDIAGKLLSRLPEEARISGFIEGLAQGLAALPEAIRTNIGATDAPVQLKAARALTEAETQACRVRLSEALGHPAEIAVDVRPELIAGLEIDMPHAVVRNSFRADLTRITAALIQTGSMQTGQEAPRPETP
ncbi:F0F1 ATP synthase subunit delta [Beijerinckia indica]|uniref:ATP synthase subunit b 3 n=1 Tax=Beijerinckia indica subsp. indica (strain ATCC 9039 / DSM 1715 / NCIMB 8712) TaxID=395963 RepID=ATPF3_BEII9|nr:ATP synthase F0 subunit B [Beijerinckia indica]B2IJX5.1 RecName: Full=ATP synthase subunit b 3; AltName: Full=ATP synthase F(0) sector subunit b 3; AltName: Full=ATPase subunit I 3; AltName: Full=F-type ATPase subunit b 3; Short=F-ATPase subunit b 3 [Beijerinckia indica subsp. indica ATCC 9039]ACB96350.1 H+transporting two-sector ATPase B/B' subunit [Beijerinckia indica subsp. indica ATCC 9039]